MKGFRIIVFCCFILLVFSACSINKPENVSIPLLLHVEAGDGTETYLGDWDLLECSVTMNEKLYQSATPIATLPILWDGKNSFVVRELPVSVEDENLFFDNTLVSDGFGIKFCDPSLKITLNEDESGIRKTIRYHDEEGNELLSEVPNIVPPKEYGIDNIVLEQEMFYAAYQDGKLYTFFHRTDGTEPGTFTVYCLAYNPSNSNNGTWAKFELAGSAMANSWYEVIVFSNNKLYIGERDDLVALDVLNDKITRLVGVTEKAKKIIPDSSQETAAGPPLAIVPMGLWDGVVLADVPIHTEDDIGHILYIAFKGEDLLGAIDITNGAINIYDRNLKLKNTCLNGTSFAIPAISLPKSS